MKKADNKRAVIVGIFVTIGIIILVTGILILGGKQKAFVKSITLSSAFEDVEGLTAGNNVWFYGVKIGTIKEVRFIGIAKVQIKMDIIANKRTNNHKNAHSPL